MLNDYAVFLSVLTYPLKPAFYSRKQTNLCAISLQRVLGKQHLSFCGLHHFEHIGKVLIHVVGSQQGR